MQACEWGITMSHCQRVPDTYIIGPDEEILFA